MSIDCIHYIVSIWSLTMTDRGYRSAERGIIDHAIRVETERSSPQQNSEQADECAGPGYRERRDRQGRPQTGIVQDSDRDRAPQRGARRPARVDANGCIAPSKAASSAAPRSATQAPARGVIAGPLLRALRIRPVFDPQANRPHLILGQGRRKQRHLRPVGDGWNSRDLEQQEAVCRVTRID